MKPILAFAAAAVLALSLAGAADAQKIDKAGKCHDAKGRFAPMSVCQGAAKAPVAEHCRNPKTGKFAKCGTPGAVPVAEKPAAPKKK